MSEEITFHNITWNVGDKPAPTEDFSSIFGSQKCAEPDIIAIGLQEVVEENTWCDTIKNVLARRDYILVKMRNAWAIWLLVYAKRCLVENISNVESESTATGLAGVVANKGGVTVRFDLFGCNLCVTNCHLPAHFDRVEDRKSSVLAIMDEQQFRDQDVEKLCDHDIVFWMGDMNFRIDHLSKQQIEANISCGNLSALTEHDQFNIWRREPQNLFQKFHEGQLSFPPTYKFDDDCDTYDTSRKQRKPAWTDRILVKVSSFTDFKKQSEQDKAVEKPKEREEEDDEEEDEGFAADLLEYNYARNVRHSDHRPVIGQFLLRIPSVFSALPVKFCTIKDSPVMKPLEFRISLQATAKEESDFKVDSWDWIGLYREDWFDARTDYAAWMYAKTSRTRMRKHGHLHKWSPSDLEPLAGCKARLIYFSVKKNCPQGYSNAFKIQSALEFGTKKAFFGMMLS